MTSPYSSVSRLEGSLQLPFFVYGTLLPGQPNYALWDNAINRAAPAILSNACLYDMGHYPMVIEGSPEKVTGMLMTLHGDRYEAALARLDFLEGFNPADPEAGEYRRVKRIVSRADGLPQVAWVYVGRRDLVSGKEMLRESWSHHCQRKQEIMSQWWEQVTTVRR